MRIIAGNLKGKSYDSPHTNRTHPMSDKIKGALFNVLGDIEGMTVLDAFAGSGALGFEAISRGASRVVVIDNDMQAQKTIAKNIDTLNLNGSVELVRSAVTGWLPRTEELFDIVIIDPPFTDIRRDVMQKVALKSKVAGIVVLSLPSAAATIATLPEPFEMVVQKNYGDAVLVFYRRSQ